MQACVTVSRSDGSGKMSENAGSGYEQQSNTAAKTAGLENTLRRTQEEQATAAGEAKAREQELKASLREAREVGVPRVF